MYVGVHVPTCIRISYHVETGINGIGRYYMLYYIVPSNAIDSCTGYPNMLPQHFRITSMKVRVCLARHTMVSLSLQLLKTILMKRLAFCTHQPPPRYCLHISATGPGLGKGREWHHSLPFPTPGPIIPCFFSCAVSSCMSSSPSPVAPAVKKMRRWFPGAQGVIGNTYHFAGKSLTAASMDNSEKAVPVQAYSDIVYPLLPDSAYELDSLFAKPALTFSSGFLNDLILMRKAAAAKVVPPAAALS